MSTRSGKRLHGTFYEVSSTGEDVVLLKTEKKTRSKRQKENEDHSEVILPKSKKKKNYVSYPSHDDEEEIVDNDVTKGKADDVIDGVPRKLRRLLTLKEQNVNVESVMDTANNNKTVRVTRQKRKFVETEDIPSQETAKDVSENQIDIVKVKKNKKKKSKSDDVIDANGIDVENEVKETKKSKKKKKGKHLKNAEVTTKNVLNDSKMSTDSFHSAAGSPMQGNNLNMEGDKKGKNKVSDVSIQLNNTSDKIQPKSDKDMNNKKRKSSKNATFDKDSDEIITNNDVEVTTEDNKSKKTKKKLKSNIKNDTFEAETVTEVKEVQEVMNITIEKSRRRKSSIKNSTFDKETEALITGKDIEEPINVTTEKGKSNRKSSIKNATFDRDSDPFITDRDIAEPLDATEKVKSNRKSSIKNTTYVKEISKVTENEHNSTYDKIEEISNETFEEPSRKKSLRSSYTIEEKANNSITLNTTFEKSDSKKPTISLDTTFDKSDTKNSTFDKADSKISSDKSSLISSDATNLTYDKDNSSISITSDESRTENIVNMTPVLIESSMEESLLSTSKKSLEGMKSSPVSLTLSVPTPLKREGTFTKEVPEVEPVKEKTPTKRMSLPSPGCTPFHTSRSSQKSVLNITRSIEKPGRRSSLAELMPRQTKVMFCSPVNNPAVVMQQKKKVIKSSLKGSNKSFVFDDSAPSRPTARKRSYTQGDAEDGRSKRKRLADDLQQSVDRLSRPRTSSAAAKLTEPTTPSKKPATPLKTKSDTKRTKLPNFAALHQKQFDRMESLGECQERKAKRARQLLTPNGALAVLERSSPKGIPVVTEPAKPKEIPKKPETPSKPPKLPTLESLRPGFTRFGFKMNTEFNPFSIPSKGEKKEKITSNFPPKTVLPVNPPLSRQPTLPSLNGATSRKEVAKQTILREKSSTSLSIKRDVKRKESRTIIKGVRTNRRFELQMQMRSID